MADILGRRHRESEKGADDLKGKSAQWLIRWVQMNTLGKGVNPITNSDLYSRYVRLGTIVESIAQLKLRCSTDHFVSAATGHQQSNRGGGSGGAATYWEVRTAKMTEQARDQVRFPPLSFRLPF